MTNNTTPQDTLIGHLTELRKRVVRSLLAIAAGAIVGLVFCKEFYRILQVPMLQALPEGSFFIATTPFESYLTYFKVSLLAGFFIASPVVFYQLWRFIAPGLKTRERKYLLPAFIVYRRRSFRLLHCFSRRLLLCQPHHERHRHPAFASNERLFRFECDDVVGLWRHL